MAQETQSASVDRITHDAQGAGPGFLQCLQGFAAKTGFERLCGWRDTEHSFRERNQPSDRIPRGIQSYPGFRQIGLSRCRTKDTALGIPVTEARHG